MTMAIVRDDGSEQYEFAVYPTVPDHPSALGTASSVVPLLKAKLRRPPVPSGLDRRSLTDLLGRFSNNSAGTLLVGRAGSGKTMLAAEFANRTTDHSWYSIDSSDADWNSFQRYFRAALAGNAEPRKSGNRQVQPAAFSASPMELFADMTASLELRGKQWPSLIVLDGVHHLFDCGWFEEFFTLLIASLPHSSHVLILSRSKPPTPVWRMRSKQVLNVVDEKLLAFSPNETEELFSCHGIGKEEAIKAHGETFGRAADIIDRLRSLVAASSSATDQP